MDLAAVQILSQGDQSPEVHTQRFLDLVTFVQQHQRLHRGTFHDYVEWILLLCESLFTNGESKEDQNPEHTSQHQPHHQRTL